MINEDQQLIDWFLNEQLKDNIPVSVDTRHASSDSKQEIPVPSATGSK
jgi:hypothetical protein